MAPPQLTTSATVIVTQLDEDTGRNQDSDVEADIGSEERSPLSPKNRIATSQPRSPSTEVETAEGSQESRTGRVPCCWPEQGENTSHKILLITEDPSVSYLARAVSVVIISLITMATLSFCLETMPAFNTITKDKDGLYREPQPVPIFSELEQVAVGIFSVEYLVRLCAVANSPWAAILPKAPSSAPDTPLAKVWAFMCRPMNIVDLLAILPFYVEMLLQDTARGLTVLRVLRLFRIFRVFRMARYEEGMRLFARVMAKSSEALILLVYFLLIAVILFGSLIYYAECGHFDKTTGEFYRDVNGAKEVSPFVSIPSSFWWVLVTTSTVGYGDMVPTTTLGRIIGVITMHVGILSLALPITIIGANFASEFRVLQEKRLREGSVDREGSVQDLHPVVGNVSPSLQRKSTAGVEPQHHVLSELRRQLLQTEAQASALKQLIAYVEATEETGRAITSTSSVKAVVSSNQ